MLWLEIFCLANSKPAEITNNFLKNNFNYLCLQASEELRYWEYWITAKGKKHSLKSSFSRKAALIPVSQTARHSQHLQIMSLSLVTMSYSVYHYLGLLKQVLFGKILYKPLK